MKDKEFEELVNSIKDMGRHMRGESVPGIRIHSFSEPDVKAIREKTGLTQAHFALLIGVSVKTLQNWEQQRVRPAGPARALLKMVEKNPLSLRVLHS